MLRKLSIPAGLLLLLGLTAPRAAHGVSPPPPREGGCGQPAGAAQALLQRTAAAQSEVEQHLHQEGIEAAETALAQSEDLLKEGEQLVPQAPPAQRGCLGDLVTAARERGARLKARLLLTAQLDDLRACHAHAQILLRRNKEPAELPSGELPDIKAATARSLRAERCHEAARRLVSEPGRGPDALIELGPQQRPRLSEVAAHLADAQRAAEEALTAARAERDRVRARWLRLLHGDRLRVFQEHPDALPGYEGKARGPLPASVVPRWQYQDESGRGETFLFRGTRLLHRTINDPRRS